MRLPPPPSIGFERTSLQKRETAFRQRISRVFPHFFRTALITSNSFSILMPLPLVPACGSRILISRNAPLLPQIQEIRSFSERRDRRNRSPFPSLPSEVMQTSSPSFPPSSGACGLSTLLS